MLTDIVRHIFRTANPANFKLGIRMEDDDPHQPQAPSTFKVKGQGHTRPINGDTHRPPYLPSGGDAAAALSDTAFLYSFIHFYALRVTYA